MKNKKSTSSKNSSSKPLNDGMSYADLADQDLHLASLNLSTLKMRDGADIPFIMREILASIWKDQGNSACFVGIVAATTNDHLPKKERTWMAYMGVIDPDHRGTDYPSQSDQVQDEQNITDWGEKLNEEIARAFFPHLKDRKYKTA